ncbi:MAG: hypothetical protein MB53_00765 [marine actinobacterium MedAcidi-G2A]|nr:MAG: hypothetical protein MB53_00765 [marine actinobacterium MedAcidi-G2A]
MKSIIRPLIPPPLLILSLVTSMARTACSPRAARFPVIGCEEPNRIMSSETPRPSSHASSASSLLELSLLELSLLELSLLELLLESSSSPPQPTATMLSTAKIASNFHNLLFIISPL